MTTTKRVEAADLRVGQVYRDDVAVALRTIIHSDGNELIVLAEYPNDGRRNVYFVDRSLFAANANAQHWKLFGKAPIPHPSALGDLYAACKALAVLAEEHAERHLGDRNAGTLVAQVRAALAKAGGK